MDILGTLNILIGLAFVYFVLSLITSAIVEGISQWHGHRGQILVQATARIIYNTPQPDSTSPKNLDLAYVKKFFSHDLILPLTQSKSRPPSYIPNDLYAIALIEVISEMRISDIKNKPWEFFSKINSLTESEISDIKKTLIRLYYEADGDIDAILNGLEKWINDVKDRASGWLKRKQTKYVLFVGFVICLFVNADTISMYNKLSHDKKLQEILVSRVTSATENSYEHVIANAADARKTEENNLKTAETIFKQSINHNGGVKTQEAKDSVNRANLKITEIDDYLDQLKAAKYYALDVSPLLGWEGNFSKPLSAINTLSKYNFCICFKCISNFFVTLLPWLNKILGILLTTFAVLMGAPFWYDILQKLIKARQTLVGKDREEDKLTNPEGSKSLRVEASNRASLNSLSTDSIKAPPPFNPTSTKLSYANAYWLARFANLAYWGEAFAKERCPDGYQIITDGLDRENASGSITNTQYLIAHDNKAIILAFRGSEENAQDWIGNAKFAQVEWSVGSTFKVHEGFKTNLESALNSDGGIKAKIESLIKENNRPIWITGHSLGGALAVLAAYTLCLEGKNVAGLYTFGQPRCADNELAKDIQEKLGIRYWRVVNNRDIVPRVPTTIADSVNYNHAGTVVYIDDFQRISIDPPFWYRVLDTLVLPANKNEAKKQINELKDDHRMDKYEQYMLDEAIRLQT